MLNLNCIKNKIIKKNPRHFQMEHWKSYHCKTKAVRLLFICSSFLPAEGTCAALPPNRWLSAVFPLRQRWRLWGSPARRSLPVNERLLPGFNQALMTATGGRVRDGGGLAHPRDRAGCYCYPVCAEPLPNRERGVHAVLLMFRLFKSFSFPFCYNVKNQQVCFLLLWTCFH